MASLELADFTDALGTVFEEELYSQINRSCPLLNLLQIKQGTAKDITWAIRYGTAAGQVFTDGQDLSAGNYQSDTKAKATLGYGIYGDAFQISNLARAGAKATGNPNALKDMLGNEFMEASERTALKIATDMYSGAGSSFAMHGFSDSAGPLAATGVYAGVDRGSVPQWASNVLSNGGVARPLTVDLMRQMRRTIYNACGLKPDLIVCDAEQHENYAKTFDGNRRYVDYVRVRGEKIMLDAGFNVLEFDGISVIEDVNCTAGEMLFLNTNFVHFYSLPPIRGGLWDAGMLEVKGSPEEQLGDVLTGFVCRVNYIANLGDYERYQPVCYPALVNKRPFASGRITDLA